MSEQQKREDDTGIDEERDTRLELHQRTQCELQGVDEEWIVDQMDCGEELCEAIQKARNDHDYEEIVDSKSIWLLHVYWNDNTDSVWVGAFGYHSGYGVEEADV